MVELEVKKWKRLPHTPDSRTAWFVCLTGFLASAIAHGSCYTFGILYPALLLEFKQSKGITALVGSLAMSLVCFFGLFAARLINYFGCRVVVIFGGLTCATSLALTSIAPNILVMFFTYCVLFGFGGCCVYSAVYCEIPRHFEKWRSTAVGLMACGPGAGLLIMSPVVGAFQAHFGWRVTYRTLAAINLVICFLGCTFNLSLQRTFDGKEQQINAVKTHTSLKTVSIFKNYRYLVYVLSDTVVLLPIYVPVIHMTKYGETIGLTLEQSSQCFIASGVSDAFARLASGWLSDSNWVSARRMYQISTLVVGVSTLLLPLATGFISILAYFLLWGLSAGTIGTCIAVLLLSCVQKKQAAQALGFWNLSIALTMSAGPPFAGFLADKFSSYSPVFYWAGSVMLVGCCILFIQNCRCVTEATTFSSENESLTDKMVALERETVL